MEISKQQDTSLTAGTIIGLMAPGIVRKAAPYAQNKIMQSLYSANRNCSKEEIDLFEKATDKAFQDSGLKEHGVSLNRVNPQTELSEAEKKVFKEIEKTPNPAKTKELQKMLASPTYQAMHGQNAFFGFLDKKVTYNKELMPATVFHEMGHAKNYCQSMLGKGLQRLSLFSQSYGRNIKAASLISFLTILAPSKSEQSVHPMKDGDEKIATFRKFGAALTALPFLPTIIEEGMASYKGEKMAKKVLSPELLKRVRKSNMSGFLSYLVIPIVWAAGTALGVKAKDNIVKEELKNTKQLPLNNTQIS
ncbi:MAG: hypothetical protein NC200_07175 [Candidatus Gastranaerophilales bacterium]|nr:hypothetical protein [Candidatus Gastranaerophilales bacterium]